MSPLNRIAEAISTFNIGSPRHDSPRGPTERPSRYGREEPAPVPRPRQTREGTNPARRQSRLSIFGNSLKSKKGGDITAEKVVDRQKSMRGQDLRQTLIDEQDELMKRISALNAEAERKSATLRSLKARDDEEKWEDELFETRLKELKSARAVINTQSSVNGRDVRDQIEDLNEEIIQTAEIAAETPLRTQRSPGQLENMTYLGGNLSLLFRKAENRLDDQKLVRAILQIFLTESCMELIDSWNLENENLDKALHGLYGRIRGKEEQTVAGKWRQITFGQLPHGASRDFIQEYSDEKAQQLMEISSAAGWGGDSSRVQRHIRKMMEEAEKIRVNVKAGIISADLQPWIAAYCDVYDAQLVKDVGASIGLARMENEEDFHVLGSTGLGLKVHGIDDSETREFKGLRSRPRVLLIESFGFRMRPRTERR